MKTKQRSLKAVLASLLSIFVMLSMMPLATVFGQTETGQITVRAVDSQGAVVGGATVTVKSVERGSQQIAKTNEEGVVTIISLQSGLYDVTVQGTGFAANTQR